MVYAAPPLRALVRVLRLLLAARGGLEGGDGVPEPTSGPPLDPGGPRSAVVEAVDGRVAKAHGVAGSAGLSARRGVRADATITTTTTVAFHGDRHCYRSATVALLAE
jgi:hypothetical protein